MSIKRHNWKLLRSTTVYDNRYLTVRRDSFRTPDRRIHDHTVIVGGRVVAIIAITRRNKVVLIEQFRPAVRRTTLDLPGGGVDRGESPAHAARRELREETGYRAKHITLLARYHSDSGRSDQVRYIYLAEDIIRDTALDDPDEPINVKTIPLRTLLHKRGFSENTLLTGLLLYTRRLKTS